MAPSVAHESGRGRRRSLRDLRWALVLFLSASFFWEPGYEAPVVARPPGVCRLDGDSSLEQVGVPSGNHSDHALRTLRYDDDNATNPAAASYKVGNRRRWRRHASRREPWLFSFGPAIRGESRGVFGFSHFRSFQPSLSPQAPPSAPPARHLVFLLPKCQGYYLHTRPGNLGWIVKNRHYESRPMKTMRPRSRVE